MSPEHSGLLARIETLAIDPPGAALSFVARLARENGWSIRYAARVDREYRRFLFLAATGTRPVTPSDAVDQAWHLHLAYTRSYWDDLCGRILAGPLHHGPTAGGAAEDARYLDQYQATLDAYARAFGTPAPAYIWPAPLDRFAGRFVRYDRRRVFLVPRAPAQALAALPLAGCVVAAASTGREAGAGSPLLWLGLGIALMLGIVLTIVARMGGGGTTSERRSDGDGGITYVDGGSGTASGKGGGGHHADSHDTGSVADGNSSGCGSSGCGGGGCGGGCGS